MKKVLIAVVFLLLLGGGAGGYLYLNRAQEPEPEPPPPLPEFVKFERFVVPIVRQGFIDGFSRVEITLEVADIDIKREVERKTPRLRDAIQTDLHAYLPPGPAPRRSGR